MKKFYVLFLVFITIFLSACYEPSPLYGNWADNDGNSISFIMGGTFAATVKKDSDGSNIKYQGDYTLLDNVISFSYTYTLSDGESGSGVMNTEWDIRGSMMYIWWTVEGRTKLLTLYHTSK